MKAKVKRFDKSLPLPGYKTSKAAAMDCQVRFDITAHPQQVTMVPLNLVIKPPTGHFVLLSARSSLHKRGLWLANGVGIGDEDFCGNEDE